MHRNAMTAYARAMRTKHCEVPSITSTIVERVALETKIASL